jgi:hypothetical protein
MTGDHDPGAGDGRFAGPAEHYDRFMGRYAPTLAVALADVAGVRPGMRVLDGCRGRLPDGPFSLEARAWCARGVVAAGVAWSA